MHVRPARPDDAAAVAEIRIAGWRSYAGLLDPAFVTGATFAEEARRSVETWLHAGEDDGSNPSGATTFVHEDDDGIDGWVSFGPDRDGPGGGEVWGLYVAPAAWGRGTAGCLLGAAADELRERGHTSLVLWCLDGNNRALAFYRKQGWGLDGTRRTRDFGPGGSADEVRLRPVVDDVPR